MSRIYDSWEKLVGAVLRREEDRQLALCDSFSSSSSADLSSRFSFDSSFFFNPFFRDVHAPAGVDKQIDQAGSSNWNVEFEPLNDVISVSRNSGQRLDPADPFSRNIFFSRNVMAIQYEEIKKATINFQPNMLVSEGGFGCVYKGWIHEHYLTAMKPGSGIAVAVKKLDLEEFLGHEQWADEIHYLSQLRHPNLIKLFGYSFDKDNRILVYEFLHKGSLYNHLFTRGHQSLPWATRIKVAMGAARALAFLHDLEIPVIHRGLKSSDILLDGDFNTKLSNFSLAIDGPTGDTTHVSTIVMGTYGYAAPEYLATGQLTTRCDVYGFGVILLELVTGLRVFDKNRPKGKQLLTNWGRPYLKDKKRLAQIVDSRLDGQYPRKEAYKVAKIALHCLSLETRFRPNMSEVVAGLEKL